MTRPLKRRRVDAPHWRSKATIRSARWRGTILLNMPSLTGRAVFEEITRIVEREIVPVWKDRLVTDIKKKDIHGLLDPIEARAPSMANCTFAVIRQFFAWCLGTRSYRCDTLHRHPCASGADAARSCAIDDEIKTLWQATGKLSWPFRDAIRLMVLTGARLNEVAGMTWDELDLDAKLWRLPKERSKNKQAHVVPLSDMASSILSAVPRVQSPRNFVFTLNGKAPVAGFSDAKRRLAAAMPGVAPWVIHDLRRTCASGMARLGVAPHVIEAFLNHQSGVISGIAATYNRYSYDTRKARRLGRMGGAPDAHKK